MAATNGKPPGCQLRTTGLEHITTFTRDWAFARASEASTLFVNQSFAKKRPYLRIREAAQGCLQFENFDGREKSVYAVREIVRRRDELVFRLAATDNSSQDDTVFTFYPYRDIDDTWVVIQALPGQDEKPIHFAIPQELSHRIEVMPDGFP